MAEINTSACVPYTPKQMYDLVNDTESYPHYLPMCSEVTVVSRSADRQTAKIALAKGKIKLAFTTANTMVDGERIDLKLVDGPFKQLRGTWRFTPTPKGGSEVSCHIEFEFGSALLSMAFSGFFKEIVESMVGRFCEQAERRYGKPAPSGLGKSAGP